MSYNDGFLLIGMSVAIVMPCVFLIRPKKQAGPPVEMGH